MLSSLLGGLKEARGFLFVARDEGKFCSVWTARGGEEICSMSRLVTYLMLRGQMETCLNINFFLNEDDKFLMRGEKYFSNLTEVIWRSSLIL